MGESRIMNCPLCGWELDESDMGMWCINPACKVTDNYLQHIKEKSFPGHAGRPGQVGGSSPGHGFSNGQNEEQFNKFVSARASVPKDKSYYLSSYDAKELADHNVRAYLGKSGKTGFAVAPDGDLQNVFSSEHLGADAVRAAIKEGATKLDCFDGKLPGYYSQFGFKEYKREANWTKGEPDVVYMRLDKTEKKSKDNTSWELLKDDKRRECVRRMKKDGVSYDEADDAFLEMIGSKEDKEEKSFTIDKAKKKMTQKEKEAYAEQFIKRMDKYEQTFNKKLVALFKKQKKVVHDNLTKEAEKEIDEGYTIKAKKDDMFLFDRDEWDQEFQSLFEDLFASIIAVEGETVLAEFASAESFNVKVPFLEDFIDNWSYKLSFDIDDVTMDMLKEELKMGIDLGESMIKIRDRVDNVFNDMVGEGWSDEDGLYRSMRIARTETIRASNGAAQEAYRQSGVVSGKEWLATADDRTCEDCIDMNGKILDLNANYFTKGEDEEADYADIDGPPLHPDCRCTLVPIVEEKDDQ